MKTILLLFAIVVITSCNTGEKLQSGQDFLELDGGKIWYQVIGDNDEIPIVLLHGGPGYPSYYLNPLKPLSKDRPVIVFDQLGCGRSDRISDTSLMTIDNHINQVRQLVTNLKIKKFYLYGHSWGSMLAIEYYLKYPEDVKALIFASPSLSTSLWASDMDTLISRMPDSLQLSLNESKQNIVTDTIKLNQAMNQFYQNFYFRKLPPSVDLDSTFNGIGLNVYHYMWGNNDFVATGTLKDYDRTNDLKEIKVPTLYITGEYDGARPQTVAHYQSLTPNSRMEVIKDVGHVTMHDAPEENIKIIADFLLDVERNE
ncbi:proline iminopeptidase [Flavobacteriaceae bacterium MAR_2010_72]|nr:proline iminopeptidase [Flavobacteriaceae bacterium MAR_2010_72]